MDLTSPKSTGLQANDIISIVSLCVTVCASIVMGWFAFQTAKIANSSKDISEQSLKISESSAEISNEALRHGREQSISQRKAESMLLAQQDIESASTFHRIFLSKNESLISDLRSGVFNLQSSDIQEISSVLTDAKSKFETHHKEAIREAADLISLADSIDSLVEADRYISRRAEYIMNVIMARETLVDSFERIQRIMLKRKINAPQPSNQRRKAQQR